MNPKDLITLKHRDSHLTTTFTTSAAVALSPSSRFTFVGMLLIWAAEGRASWAALSLI